MKEGIQTMKVTVDEARNRAVVAFNNASKELLAMSYKAIRQASGAGQYQVKVEYDWSHIDPGPIVATILAGEEFSVSGSTGDSKGYLTISWVRPIK